MMVRVVSRQFDIVRVEQNHCQGLQTVNASYQTTGHCISLALRDFGRDLPLNAMNTTYSCPCLIASSPVDPFS